MTESKVNIRNKKARFEYHVMDEFTAGMCLGEVFIRNMHITEYENGSFYNHKPRSDRKLLLNRKEIHKIEKFLQVKGNTLIPLKMYISEKGWVKLQIACALGKKLHDKRQDMKEKDAKMEMSRVMKK